MLREASPFSESRVQLLTGPALKKGFVLYATMTESYYKEQTIRGKHSLIHSSPTIQRSMSLARPILTTSRRIHCQAVWGQNVALRCSSTDASQTDALGVPELSNHLAEEFDLSKAESKRIVTSLFDYIAEVSTSKIEFVVTVRIDFENKRCRSFHICSMFS